MTSPKTCDQCGRAYPAEAQLCLVCGIPLEESPSPAGEPSPAPPARPAGEAGGRVINIVDTGGSTGPVVQGKGARATQVNEGGTYIENQQLQAARRCPNPACAQPLQPTDNFCPHCGARLIRAL